MEEEMIRYPLRQRVQRIDRFPKKKLEAFLAEPDYNLKVAEHMGWKKMREKGQIEELDHAEIERNDDRATMLRYGAIEKVVREKRMGYMEEAGAWEYENYGLEEEIRSTNKKLEKLK